MPAKVCLIVPCFNEAGRLDIERFGAPPAGITCLLVDDGSRDGTLELARRHASSTLGVLPLPQNVGKGEAVRQGMLHARASGLLDGVQWVGYWDADLATPLSEVEHFLAYATLESGRVDGILGSRIYKLGSRIVRSYRRHLLGRCFTTLAATLLGLQCYDSQCGAKLFRTDLVEAAFGEPFVSRWIFDIEILLRLRQYRLIECPLREWADVSRSKLSIVKVAAPTMVDLLRIRRRYLTTRDQGA
ncbi:MAG: glycosyltransferase [Gemmatimonadetes bacterium]|nr:glycosyltransferase [Gemmatimonadota bacterium]